MKLSEEQIQEYRDNGFISVKGLFSPEEIQEIRDAYDVVWDRAQEKAKSLENDERIAMEEDGARYTFSNKTLRFIAWCGHAHPTFQKFGDDQRLIKIAGQLLGSDTMEQLINQIHFKMPSDGQAFAWHQDSQHRGMGNGGFKDINGLGSYVQCALAIDDVTDTNGPLGIIPGTNKLGHVEHYLTPDGYTLPSENYNELQAIYPKAKTGDVLFFGPYTVHGSTVNMSDKSRRIFINGFAYPGANIGGRKSKMHTVQEAVSV